MTSAICIAILCPIAAHASCMFRSERRANAKRPSARRPYVSSSRRARLPPLFPPCYRVASRSKCWRRKCQRKSLRPPLRLQSQASRGAHLNQRLEGFGTTRRREPTSQRRRGQRMRWCSLGLRASLPSILVRSRASAASRSSRQHASASAEAASAYRPVRNGAGEGHWTWHCILATRAPAGQ